MTSKAWHLWQGERVALQDLGSKIPALAEAIEQSASSPLDTQVVVRACDQLSKKLRDHEQSEPLRQSLLACNWSKDEIEVGLREIGDFMQRPALMRKLQREFGTTDPLTPRRFDIRSANFESWAPLGCLLHIAPGNSFSVGVLSVIEGLLAGNLNILKLSSSDGEFPLLFLQQLIQEDSSGMLRNFIIAARISSSDQDTLKKFMQQSAAIAVWGGEEAVANIRSMAPPSVRIVAWGHRISFAYISADALQQLNNEQMLAIAADVNRLDQQACASPQCIYLETNNIQQLQDFASRLGKALDIQTKQLPMPTIDDRDAAEISMTNSLQRCESALELGSILEAKDCSWRIYIDHRSALRASPLYRSVWIKPLSRSQIFSTLWPMREFLQTCGLCCTAGELAELSKLLVASGVLRITELGKMLNSYNGEPHDGVYALPSYAKRVSFQIPSIGAKFSSFAELQDVKTPLPWAEGDKPLILSKEYFQDQQVGEDDSEIVFRSGGSSGKPKVSVFTYEDYQTQMQLAADGLFAAGLDPTRDRCMNLFYGGGLYGGFLSFFTILEKMRAVQFPMAAHLEWAFVVDTILEHRIDTLLGMPSYLMQLFNHPGNIERLSKTKPIKKIFYGGEHFTEQQRHAFQERFGVQLIRSATYGSVDAGPLGYQCSHSKGSIHHLHQRLQILEILQIDRDSPAGPSEIGRMIFTSLTRQNQKIYRYDIGDLGRWVDGKCDCGRLTPRFEVLGRHGDIFRAGATFFNYNSFYNVVSQIKDYSGEMQIVIDSTQDKSGGRMDRVRVLIGTILSNPEQLCEQMLREVPELDVVVNDEKIMCFEVTVTEPGSFKRTSSGKLRRVVDLRH